MSTRSHAHLSRVVTLRCPAALLPRVDDHVLRYPRRSGWPRRTLDELLFQASYVHHSKEFSFRQGGCRQLAPHSSCSLYRFFNTHFRIILAEQRSSSRTEADTQSMRRTRRSLRLRIRFDPVDVPRFARAAPRGAVLCPRRRWQQARLLPALKVTTRALGSKSQRGDFNDQTRGDRTVTTL